MVTSAATPLRLWLFVADSPVERNLREEEIQVIPLGARAFFT
ncbi:MAG: hypothetical protein U5K56_05215 [Halioglobus sp.]|nr:hypothetical protein [Halioglobus sp.]